MYLFMYLSLVEIATFLQINHYVKTTQNIKFWSDNLK